MGSINILEFVCILCVYVHPLFSLHRCCSLCVVLFFPSILYVDFLLFAPLCVPADAHKDSRLFQRKIKNFFVSWFSMASDKFNVIRLFDSIFNVHSYRLPRRSSHTLHLSSNLSRFVWLKLIFINDLFLLHSKFKFVIFSLFLSVYLPRSCWLTTNIFSFIIFLWLWLSCTWFVLIFDWEIDLKMILFMVDFCLMFSWSVHWYFCRMNNFPVLIEKLNEYLAMPIVIKCGCTDFIGEWFQCNAFGFYYPLLKTII